MLCKRLLSFFTRFAQNGDTTSIKQRHPGRTGSYPWTTSPSKNKHLQINRKQQWPAGDYSATGSENAKLNSRGSTHKRNYKRCYARDSPSNSTCTTFFPAKQNTFPRLSETPTISLSTFLDRRLFGVGHSTQSYHLSFWAFFECVSFQLLEDIFSFFTYSFREWRWGSNQRPNGSVHNTVHTTQL